MRKVIGIIFLVAAGLVLSIVPSFAMFAEPWSRSNPYGFFVAFGIVFLVASVLCAIGVVIRGVQRWRRDTAITLLSVAAYNAFLFIMVGAVLADKELVNTLAKSRGHSAEDIMRTLSGWPNALALTVLMAVIGILLLRSAKSKIDPALKSAGDSSVR